MEYLEAAEPGRGTVARCRPHAGTIFEDRIMSNMIEVPAEIRNGSGKGASRRLRHEGLVPGILYGAGKDSVSLQLGQRYLLHALEEESFFTSILELTVGDGRRQRVILRDLQRHPYKPQVMHIDFQRISETEKLRISVPIHFLNEDESPAGSQSGVVVSHQITEVEISCLPKDLPEFLSLDLTTMDVGDIVNLSEIPLPEGVEITALAYGEDSIDSPVVTAQHIVIQVEETEEEVDAEAVEGDEEGEAAPESDQQAEQDDDRE
jgi:large subunit ribosomal protein L25